MLLTSAGGSVGLYSTASQWKAIVGTVTTSTPLAGLGSWLPGAHPTGRPETANWPRSPSGEEVTLTQWTTAGSDHDHSLHLAHRLAPEPRRYQTTRARVLNRAADLPYGLPLAGVL